MQKKTKRKKSKKNKSKKGKSKKEPCDNYSIMLNFVRYIGSKGILFPIIYSHFPKNYEIFVDVFGGSGVVLLSKKPSKIEVYNDIDERIYNLFNVIKNKEKFDKLIEMLNFSLYSRKEFHECLNRLSENKYNDDVQKAYDYFIYLNQTIVPVIYIYRKTFSSGLTKNKPKEFFNKIKKLNLIHNRLKNVYIECLDYKDILKLYSSEKTLFYIDPPYILSNNKLYYNKFTKDNHIELIDNIIDCANKTKSKFLISGYESEIYNKILQNGFNISKIEKYISCDVIKKGENSKRNKVVECLWYNYIPISDYQKILYY